jgi:hypothetical protein
LKFTISGYAMPTWAPSPGWTLSTSRDWVPAMSAVRNVLVRVPVRPRESMAATVTVYLVAGANGVVELQRTRPSVNEPDR